MKIPIAPLNNLFVTIEKKFYDTVSFESGITLYKDTTFHPEESAMIIGKVVSVPNGIQQRPDYEGFQCRMEPGDIILMRYDVVFCYIDQPDRDTPIYKNVLLYNGAEYWRVNIQQVFAIQRGNGWEMVNGYVMGDNINVERRGAIFVPEVFQASEYNHTMRVRHIGPAAVVPGDIIHVMPNVAQRYELDADVFYIIKQSHVLGKTG